MQHNGDGQNNENFWGENLSIDFDPSSHSNQQMSAIDRTTKVYQVFYAIDSICFYESDRT